MDTNTQVDYKVRLSYILNAFGSFFSSSNKAEEKLKEEIKKIENQQDSSYINSLESDSNYIRTTRKPKSKRENLKVNSNVKAKTKKNDKIAEIDEKEL